MKKKLLTVLIENDAATALAVGQALDQHGHEHAMLTVDQLLSHHAIADIGCMIVGVDPTSASGRRMHTWWTNTPATPPLIYIGADAAEHTIEHAVGMGSVAFFDRRLHAPSLAHAVSHAMNM